jgi:hypothetical protein
VRKKSKESESERKGIEKEKKMGRLRKKKDGEKEIVKKIGKVEIKIEFQV